MLQVSTILSMHAIKKGPIFEHHFLLMFQFFDSLYSSMKCDGVVNGFSVYVLSLETLLVFDSSLKQCFFRPSKRYSATFDQRVRNG